jgi:hypothetical protein
VHVLEIDMLISIVLANCSHGSKDGWVNFFEQVKQVCDLCPIVRDFHWDVLSILSKGNARLLMQHHMFHQSDRGCSNHVLFLRTFLASFTS